MIDSRGTLHCDMDDCSQTMVTIFGADRRGAIEAVARRHGWGAWPGLTIRGKPAPEHVCPSCRKRDLPPRIPRGTPIPGQEDLGFKL